MKRRLLTALFAAATLTISAQPRSGAESFRPKKGDWQISLTLGRGQFFSQEKMQFLLPTIDLSTGAMADVGPGLAPEYILKIGEGSVNNNSVVNMAGVQIKWFVADRWDLNLTAALDLNMTPSKDYEEGVAVGNGSSALDVPGSKYIYGNVIDNWMVDFGFNYHFLPRNDRLTVYIGAVAGYRMGGIQQRMPYTGIEVPSTDGSDTTDPIELYAPASSGGSLYGIKGGIVFGAEFAIARGLILGLEVNPVTYYYSFMRISPRLTGHYHASHHNLRAFTCPNFRLGFRF